MPLPVQVILKDEDLDPAFDFREAAELSDGYSGGQCRCREWGTTWQVFASLLSSVPSLLLPERSPAAPFPLCAPSLSSAGSDLKNLCIAAAYCPIREHLDAERAAAKAAGSGGGGPTASASPGGSAATAAATAAAAAAAAAASSARPAALAAVAAHVVPQPVRLRSINMSDFKAALKQVCGAGQGAGLWSGGRAAVAGCHEHVQPLL